MMHARAALREEPGDTAVGVGGGDELHVRRTVAQKHRLHTLIGHGLANGHIHAKTLGVHGDGGVDVLDDVSNVMDEAQMH